MVIVSATPTPLQIYTTRLDAGLTQKESAALVYVGLRAWQAWEQGKNPMHPGLWELYLIKIAAGHTAPAAD